MEYVIGILLLVSFVGLAVYAVRGGNLMMGMLIMGIIWTVLPLIGNTFATNPEFIAAYPGITDISFVDAITKVFQSGPEGWGSVLVNVVFGAWFGRVLLQTGIADALIRKAVELVVVKHFCNTLFENSPGISSFKWCFPIIVGMRTDMIVPYVHISV